MTANPKPDTSQALVAVVRAGNIESFSKLADYLEALIRDHALIERDHSELRQRYALLAEFVREVAGLSLPLTAQVVIDAGDLLAKLAEGKTR